MCQNLKDFLNGKKYKNINLYLDETNNTRMLSLKNKKDSLNFNIDIKNNDEIFFLGGVFFQKDKKINYDYIQEFKNNELSEFKFKSYIRKNISRENRDNFLKIISSKNALKLFNFIKKNDIKIWFSAIDIFYYGIADLIDPISHEVIKNAKEKYYFGLKEEVTIHNFLKSLFNNYIKKNNDEFKQFIKKNNIPHMSNVDISIITYLKNSIIKEYNEDDFYHSKNNSEFYKEVINILNEIDIKNVNLLKSIKTFEENFSKKDLNKNILVDHYNEMYILQNVHLSDSNIFYDENGNLNVSYLQKNDKNNNKLNSLDSKDNILIQICDIVVNLVKRFFNWVANKDNINDFCFEILMKTSSDEKEALRIWLNLLNDTNYKYRNLINYIINDSQRYKLYTFTNFISKTLNKGL